MIPLYVDNGTAYVWNSEDWFTLRTKYHICGSLLGSVPSYPRQNDFLGLPMALMSEEAALLIEMGICELFKLQDIIEKPSEIQKQEIKAQEQKVLAEQTEALRKRKIEQLSQKIDVIMAGKRLKILSSESGDIVVDKETLLLQEIYKLPDVTPAHTLVHLPTQHYLPAGKTNVGVEALTPSVTDKVGAIKYAIFKDLWQKGHHITSGSKFGCDYLVYPGDPVKFHAMYMVKCISSENNWYQPKQLVALGRLSVAVNKLAVLAYCTPYGIIEYQTLQWHNK